MAGTTANQVAASQDRVVWTEAMRDVIPLRGRSVGRSPAPAEPPTAIAAEQAAKTVALSSPTSGGGIDRATAERLKRGLHRIEARLDLHGRTQAEAHRDLAEFVEASHQAGKRCVLVITGRGLGPAGPGVLKAAVPRWLAEAGLRRRVLAIAAAQPRHGGAGALYLLLRRRR